MWCCWNTSRTRPRPLRSEQFAIADGGDARGILAAVLQHGQRVVDALVDRAGSDDADDAAHAWIPQVE